MAISSASRYFLFFFRFPFLLSAFVFNAAARANFFLCGFFGVSPPVGPSPTAFRALRLNEPFSQFCILPREAFLRGGLPSLRDFVFCLCPGLYPCLCLCRRLYLFCCSCAISQKIDTLFIYCSFIGYIEPFLWVY